MTRCLFIAATGQNVGKTSISLALIWLLSKRFKKIGFIKPVTQRYIQFPDGKVGEEAVLIKEVFKWDYNLNDMCPVVIDEGFTERFIEGKRKLLLSQKVLKAYENIKKEAELVIIEGAGHAGVGSVVNLSNAEVAKLLDADVLLIGGGGIGRTIDELALDKVFFEAKGCRVAGVIINKVLEEKYDKVSSSLRRWFKAEKIPLLGILPYRPSLSSPSLSLIAKTTRALILSGKGHLDKNIDKIIVGTMEPEALLRLLRGIRYQTLLITSSDRIDLILAVFTNYFNNMSNTCKLAGVLLSGKQKLPESIRDILDKVDIPVLIVDEDVYTLASRIYSLRAKITSHDTEKIKVLNELAQKYINIEALCEVLNSEKQIAQRSLREKIMFFFYRFWKRMLAFRAVLFLIGLVCLLSSCVAKKDQRWNEGRIIAYQESRVSNGVNG